MIPEISSIMGPHVCQALGWTIVHSLWQISIIALVMSALHKVYAHKPAETRYTISVGAMLAAACASLVTFLFFYYSGQDGHIVTVAMNTALPSGSTDISTTTASSLNALYLFFAENLNTINSIWSVGLLLFVAKMIGAFFYVRVLRQSGTPCTDDQISSTMERLTSRMQIDKVVTVAESVKVGVPMVLGHIKPIILLPIGIINILEMDEIEAILAHELSHIKRNDYIINIGLTVIEIVYYYHPAMWWISANVKAERENCCDDATLSQGVAPIQYAKALLKLEEFRKSVVPQLAMPLLSNQHQLLNRIKRILNMEQTRNDIREKSVATVLLLTIAVLFTTSISSQSVTENDLHPTILEGSATIETEENDTMEMEIVGDDEIIVEVEKGAFKHLKIDGEIITEGAAVDQLRKSFSGTQEDKYDQIFFLQGNPRLTYDGIGYALYGDDTHIEFDKVEDVILADTFPTGVINSNAQVTIITDIDGRQVELSRTNGDISSLKVDGKTIPQSQHHEYQELIDETMDGLTFSFDIDDHVWDASRFPTGRSLDSILTKSFGMVFDGHDWRQFGGNLEHLLEEGVLEKLQEMEEMRVFPFESEIEIDRIQSLEDFFGDSDSRILRFDTESFPEIDWDTFDDLDALRDLPELQVLRHDKLIGRATGGKTVVDQIGSALQRDGLLEAYKANKIELTGKHLKINGDKMPKALHNKYKNIYQESTGAPLTKKSKMVFEVEGKPTSKKIRGF